MTQLKEILRRIATPNPEIHVYNCAYMRHIQYMYKIYVSITCHQHLRDSHQFGSFWRNLFVISIPRCMYWKKMLLSETWFSSSQLMRCWVCSRRATYTVTHAKTWFTPKMKITHCRIVEMCLPRIIPRASSKLSSSVIASTAWQAKAIKTALAVPKFEDLIKSIYLQALSPAPTLRPSPPIHLSITFHTGLHTVSNNGARIWAATSPYLATSRNQKPCKGLANTTENHG